MTEVVTQASALGERTGLRADVVAGRRVLAALPDMERLAVVLHAPITARTAWIRARLDAEPDAEPWAAVVRTGDGRLVAATVVLQDGAGARLAAGSDDHRGAVLGVDAHAASVAGRSIAGEAERRGLRTIAGTLQDDELTRAFADGAGLGLLPASSVPALVADAGCDLASYLSHGVLRTLRKARNRLAADDRTTALGVTRDGQEIIRALPAMERLYRARDDRHGVASGTEGPDGLRAWRARARRLLDHCCLDLATLTVDGELAAYVLGVPDGSWYRILDGRMNGAFARYAPGRLLEAYVVERALAAGAGVDWMTAVAPDTLLAATATQPVVTLIPTR